MKITDTNVPFRDYDLAGRTVNEKKLIWRERLNEKKIANRLVEKMHYLFWSHGVQSLVFVRTD